MEGVLIEGYCEVTSVRNADSSQLRPSMVKTHAASERVRGARRLDILRCRARDE
jgi:hypothetical protein